MERMRHRHDEEIGQLQEEIAALEQELLEEELFDKDKDQSNSEERRGTIIQAGRTRRQSPLIESSTKEEALVLLPKGKRSEVACAKQSDIEEIRTSMSSRESSPQKVKRVLRSMVGKISKSDNQS